MSSLIQRDAIHNNMLDREDDTKARLDRLERYPLSTPIQPGTIIGTEAAKSSLPGLTIARLLTDTNNARGFHDATIYSGYAGRAYASFDAFAETGGSNNLDHLINFQARNEHAGTGTLGTYYGFGSFPNLTGGTTAVVYGFYAEDPWGAGTITTNYGLYIDDMTRGSTNYAIYTGSGDVSFGGGVTIRAGNFATSAGSLNIASTTTSIGAVRTVANTTGHITLGTLRAKSSGNMADTFGSVVVFQIEDTAAVVNSIGYIGAERVGADNTGDIVLVTYAAGSASEKLRVTSGGDVKVIVGRLYPVAKTTAAAPTYAEGAIYYDTTLHKLRVGGASGWETVTSS